MVEIDKLFKNTSTFERNKKIILNGGLTEKMFEQIYEFSPFKEHPHRILSMYGEEIRYLYEFDIDEVIGVVTNKELDTFFENRINYVNYVIFCRDFKFYKFKISLITRIAYVKMTDNFVKANDECGDFYNVLREDYELIDENYLDDYEEFDYDLFDYNPTKTKTVEEVLTKKSIDKLLIIQNYYKHFIDRTKEYKIFMR